MLILHLSVFALLLTAFICAFGSFNQRFEDNFMQRLGLALLGFSCVLRAYVLWDSDWPSVIESMLYLSMMLFALGTVMNNKHFLRPACLPSSKPTLR